MGARFRSWWQQIKQHRIAIGVVAMVLVVAITLIIVGYFDWAGFNGYNKITVAHTISGTNAGTVIRTEEYQPGRTLWDWMQLLIIPVVLAVGGYVINLTISRGEQEATKQRAKTERETTEDNQREAALQAYIDKISELLINENLRNAPNVETQTIARVRTLTLLSRLDCMRKRSVIHFLFEAHLIFEAAGVIDLSGADLSNVDFTGAFLSGANLRGANLRGATLVGADFSGADLYEANLVGADLFGADFREADLAGACIAEATLIEINLTFAQLQKTDFRDSDIQEAQFEDANLSKALLEDAYLMKSSFVGATLEEADLTGANLTEADLSEAFLVKANLTGAILREVDFTGANLIGADLTGADLSGAKITDEQLAKARSLEGATMPDGSIHP